MKEARSQNPGGRNIRIVFPFWLLAPDSWLLVLLRFLRFTVYRLPLDDLNGFKLVQESSLTCNNPRLLEQGT
jgi:hypothetical protein